mmetsp:Transcript_13525/g.18888  ORF Transcript_13525/g.18888 Transcript_13525/m.18888 type:complete len:82 (+) Transcript_13525:1639-1884(+)
MADKRVPESIGHDDARDGEQVLLHCLREQDARPRNERRRCAKAVGGGCRVAHREKDAYVAATLLVLLSEGGGVASSGYTCS